MIRTGFFNRVSTGFIVGLVLPLIVFLVVFLFSSADKGLADYLGTIDSRNIITHFISLCVFPNVFAFLLFNRFDKLKSSRGVLGMTIIWALLVFIIKFV